MNLNGLKNRNQSVVINLRFQPNKPFSPSTNTNHQEKELNEIKNDRIVEVLSKPTNTESIVNDTSKWPQSLRIYCAKVYKHYQDVNYVTDNQVTAYLNQRILDAFKEKPDLNINWNQEAIPDLIALYKTTRSPLSKPSNKADTQQSSNPSQFSKHAEQKRKTQSSPMFCSNTDTTTLCSSASSTSLSEIITSKKAKIAVLNNSNVSNNNINSNNKIIKTKKSKNVLSAIKINNNSDERYIENDEDMMYIDDLSSSQKNFNITLNSNSRIIKVDNDQSTNLKVLFSLEDMESSRTFSRLSIPKSVSKKCIGTNNELEKEYLRLTGPPESSMIRPLHVLRKSLEFVLDKYNKKNDYRYICDQLKAIRQDLTVQMIQNEFTIEVYETHGRIAIKNRDRDEFNQCQNCLKNLYALNKSKQIVNRNSAEFLGYRLLYNMLTKSFKDLNLVMNEIKSNAIYKSNAYLQHLLDLKNAWMLNNYIKFFRLYKISNEMSKNLIDLFIERERKNALKLIMKSYRPAVKLEYIQNILAYESLESCRDSLLAYNISIMNLNSQSCGPAELFIDCKSCSI